MAIFGWISAVSELPSAWDLRLRGWTMCDAGEHGALSIAGRAECRHVLLVDARGRSAPDLAALAEADRPAWRLMMLGVEDAVQRARLITGGCAEALPAATALRELDARARRVTELFRQLPRWRPVGPLLLDLFHRDGRLDGRWLGLHPREFGLLWRLADRPGEQVTRAQLLRDVWRLEHDPETNSLEVHVSRLRGKLARLGCARLIETVPTGGYRIARGLAARGPICGPASDSDSGRSANPSAEWPRHHAAGG